MRVRDAYAARRRSVERQKCVFPAECDNPPVDHEVLIFDWKENLFAPMASLEIGSMYWAAGYVRPELSASVRTDYCAYLPDILRPIFLIRFCFFRFSPWGILTAYKSRPPGGTPRNKKSPNQPLAGFLNRVRA